MSSQAVNDYFRIYFLLPSTSDYLAAILPNLAYFGYFFQRIIGWNGFFVKPNKIFEYQQSAANRPRTLHMLFSRDVVNLQKFGGIGMIRYNGYQKCVCRAGIAEIEGINLKSFSINSGTRGLYEKHNYRQLPVWKSTLRSTGTSEYFPVLPLLPLPQVYGQRSFSSYFCAAVTVQLDQRRGTSRQV